MVRYVGWLANTMLFVLCCFLVADTANAIIAALLAEPATALSTEKPDTGATQSSWEERQVIVRRNLFHSSDLTPKPLEPEPVPDVLEETKLPLKLWGTIASDNADLAWASVKELDSLVKGSQAVRVGDHIKTAEVLAIERRRIVLLENGTRRALSLDDDDAPQAKAAASPFESRKRSRSARSKKRSRRSSPSAAARKRRSARERSARKAASKPVEPPVLDKIELDPDEVQQVLDNPAALYTQASIEPQMDEDGELSGIEISDIKPGSIFEQVGIEDGDIITAIRGESISDVGQSSRLLATLNDGESIDVTVRNASGEIVTRQYQSPPQ
jgi:general secretion pathway protein C